MSNFKSTWCGQCVLRLLVPALGFIAVSPSLERAAVSSAADTLIHSFETDIEGFEPNGGIFTVAQDTIGATEGTHSMKVALTGHGFVGAQTAVIPAAFGDPPGLDYVKFDVTLPVAFPDPGFAVIGMTIFGMTQEGELVDLQTGPSEDDPTLEFHLDGLAAGTHTDIIMDLNKFTHPVTNQPATFNEIYGTQGSGPNDLIITGYQFYFNKTPGLSHPLTVYIDNVRVGNFPDIVEGDYNGNGFVDAADYTVWRDNLGLLDVATVAEGDGDLDGDVTQADYDFWKTRFGMGGGGSIGASAVPEPATGLLLVMAACMTGIMMRGGWGRR
jgi:hypothetical protein